MVQFLNPELKIKKTPSSSTNSPKSDFFSSTEKPSQLASKANNQRSQQENQENAKDLEELKAPFVQLLQPQSVSRIIAIDDIRDFEKFLYLSAPKNQWKIGIIEPADTLNDQASNALLKTLEEPPKNTLLLLITTNPDRLLPTILSRCVNVHLFNTEPKKHNNSELALLQSIATHCKQGFSTDLTALKMKAVFAKILADCKQDISKNYELAFKEEEKKYKKIVEHQWLKNRQKYYEALSSSHYLKELNYFIDVLITWLGDIIRAKSKHPHRDFIQLKTITEHIANTEEIAQLLQRMQALENLREHLKTNASEPLALEVGFLKAFGTL